MGVLQPFGAQRSLGSGTSREHPHRCPACHGAGEAPKGISVAYLGFGCGTDAAAMGRWQPQGAGAQHKPCWGWVSGDSLSM